MPVVTLPSPFQLINGKQYDFTSIEITVLPQGGPPQVRFGVKSLNYNHGLKPGEGRGTRAQIALRSRGKYEAGADFEMYKSEYTALITSLAGIGGGGSGYMEVPFDITVAYAESGQPTITDRIQGCRIMKDTDSNSEDGGVSLVKCELHVMQIIRGGFLGGVGLSPVEPSRFLK